MHVYMCTFHPITDIPWSNTGMSRVPIRVSLTDEAMSEPSRLHTAFSIAKGQHNNRLSPWPYLTSGTHTWTISTVCVHACMRVRVRVRVRVCVCVCVYQAYMSGQATTQNDLDSQ